MQIALCVVRKLTQHLLVIKQYPKGINWLMSII